MKAKLIAIFAVILSGMLLASPGISGNADRSIHVVALGTSLTAGFGLPSEDGFTEQLSRALSAKGINATIENAGVSGDTSTGGLARLDWAISPNTHAIIIELGSNDALRGLDPAETEQNLREILLRSQSRNLPILLAGMRAPPNLGSEYAAEFEPIYSDLAGEFGTLLYPFFLDGVAAQPALNQGDGIHPNAEGVAVIVERMMPSVLALIDRAKNHNKTP